LVYTDDEQEKAYGGILYAWKDPAMPVSNCSSGPPDIPDWKGIVYPRSLKRDIGGSTPELT
jgi:hypothetical protein